MESNHMLRLGILHPGVMGVSVAASALKNRHAVYWASEGRSAATRARAQEHHLVDVGTLANVCATCDIILTVCPPHAAEELAQQVVAQKFRGIYVDANAISPQRAIRMGGALNAAGIEFVDGGIVGGPAWQMGETVLYLSGERAQDILEYFQAGPLEVRVIGSEIGKASAFKMCYAAHTKGITALLVAILAAAEALNVRQELYQAWARDDSNMERDTERRVRQATVKAWRFAGEMDELALTWREAGVPDGFYQASAEIFRRLAHFKGRAELPPLPEVLTAARFMGPVQRQGELDDA